ncbi:MAG TPA: hypothetical protein VEY71_06005 [Chitinophagales bacterium]|nr:hypothetical protein [Chitinophagales bacterium]
MKTNPENKPAKKTTVKKTAGAKKSAAKPAKKSSRKSDDDDEFEEFGIDEEFRTTDFKANAYDDEDDDY